MTTNINSKPSNITVLEPTEIDSKSNPLSQFDSYTFKRILIMCDTTQTAQKIIDMRSNASGNAQLVETKPMNAIAGKGLTHNGNPRVYAVVNEYVDAQFTIKNIEWDTFFINDDSGDVNRINTTNVSGKMTLQEPQGAYFMNLIAQTAMEMKIELVSTVYLLFTDFIGYNSSSSTPATIIQTKPVHLHITNIVTVFDITGTIYDIDFVCSANGLGYQDYYSSSGPTAIPFTIDSDVYINSISNYHLPHTIDDVLTSLQNYLQVLSDIAYVDSVVKNQSGNIKRVVYHIELDPWYKNSALTHSSLPPAQLADKGKLSQIYVKHNTHPGTHLYRCDNIPDSYQSQPGGTTFGFSADDDMVDMINAVMQSSAMVLIEGIGLISSQESQHLASEIANKQSVKQSDKTQAVLTYLLLREYDEIPASSGSTDIPTNKQTANIVRALSGFNKPGMVKEFQSLLNNRFLPKISQAVETTDTEIHLNYYIHRMQVPVATSTNSTSPVKPDMLLNYYYTGENTQILRFDFKLSQAYAFMMQLRDVEISTPSRGGSFISHKVEKSLQAKTTQRATKQLDVLNLAYLATFEKYALINLANVNVEIVGNPALMNDFTRDPGSYGADGNFKKEAQSENNLIKHAYETHPFTMAINMKFKTPHANFNNSTTFDTNASQYHPLWLIKDIPFLLVQCSNKFTDGQFTQTLKLILSPLSAINPGVGTQIAPNTTHSGLKKGITSHEHQTKMQKALAEANAGDTYSTAKNPAASVFYANRIEKAFANNKQELRSVINNLQKFYSQNTQGESGSYEGVHNSQKQFLTEPSWFSDVKSSLNDGSNY